MVHFCYSQPLVFQIHGQERKVNQYNDEPRVSSLCRKNGFEINQPLPFLSHYALPFIKIFLFSFQKGNNPVRNKNTSKPSPCNSVLHHTFAVTSLFQVPIAAMCTSATDSN
jgi:hypothetical protein